MGLFKTRIDITGQKFNRLTAIKVAYTKNNRLYWLFKCDCGKEKILRGVSVKAGETKSCGCLLSEKLVRGEKHFRWKGDKAGYGAIHSYVRKRINKIYLCQLCFIKPTTDLANISQSYKRDLSDWLQLCHKCHMNFDHVGIKANITKKRNLSLLNNYAR